MIQITPQTRILLAIEPVDFRKGIDGLAAVCRARLKRDPFSGTMFIFRNRRGSSIKVLFYDGQGFWLCTKRLSKGKLTWWPSRHTGGENTLMQLAAYQLQLLLWNTDLSSIKQPEIWKPILLTPG
jgi:transposase